MAKPKSVRATQFIAALYNQYKPVSGITLREHLGLINRLALMSVGRSKMVINTTLKLNSPNTYTYIERGDPNIRRIVLGGISIKKLGGLPDLFVSKEAMRAYFGIAIKVTYALDFHELGHILFTDMNSTFVQDEVEFKYQNFVHGIVNTIEDPVVEILTSRHFKKEFPKQTNPSVYFNTYKQTHFMPAGEKYTDDGTVGAFLQYILLLVRIGRKNIKNTNSIYEKYRKDLEEKLRDCLTEVRATPRLRKTVDLGKWIIENIKELHFETAPTVPHTERIAGSVPTGEMPPIDGIPGEGEGLPGEPPSGKKEKSEGAEETKKSEEDSESKSKGEDEPSKEEEKGKGAEDETPSEEEGLEEKEPEYAEDPEIEDEVFSDEIRDGSDHYWVKASEEFILKEDVLPYIDERIQKYQNEIVDISKFLSLFEGRKKPRMMSGFRSGKLDLKRAMQDEGKGGCDLNLFMRSQPRGRKTDLAISLLGDNSGSMRGEKSEICCDAMLALAQACEWAKVPFECNLFTKDRDVLEGTSITITLKEFEEPFDKMKAYFGISSSELSWKFESPAEIPIFRGNSEEVNLFYIWQKLRKNEHKNKLLIVTCDGSTTGSQDTLKRIIQEIEDDGITVIGIGVLCQAVAHIYPEHKLFGTTEQLKNELANYLTDTLTRYITNK